MDEHPTRMAEGLTKALISPYLSRMEPVPTDLSPLGRLKPPIRCLLCDIYGTLLISASGDVGQDPHHPLRYERLASVLERHGITRPAEEMVASLHDAIKREHAQAKANGVDHPEVQIDAVWQRLLPSKSREQIRKFALEFEMVFNPVWPMPGLSQLLSACRKRGIQLGIISNAQFFTPLLLEWLTDTPMKRLGFSPELTFFSYRHGVAKPSDRLFRMAAEQLKKSGIEPSHAAYIGNDLNKDILPAGNQGYQTILFAGDARSLRLEYETGQIDAPKPDLIVTGLHQVISYF